ncbi:nucleoside hydrolase-like domain-containing protein [Sphingobacterium chuzhouense]|uniref:nucleoside hydrolase-like domain-containing protein n=1 Tax=Sphingobacterium chuzhouense TaxID=1742264 RepID=UPI001CC1F21E|nr:nucleoside hydrolase-like domain-containing protein [Sphingobacterium chuzhouense]
MLKIYLLSLIGMVAITFVVAQSTTKPRIIISTDIGGTDPDDNQSMIHLLMYSDMFEIEGLISSPYDKGRKKDILEMIDLYEKDYSILSKRNPALRSAHELREKVKQGVIEAAPYKGYAQPTEGSEWIITCAKKANDKPLWILVWGGLEDVAQALHDAPEIKSQIRVFWIGGPNKKWGINAYNYIVENHPDVWFIESNATYRGWFMEDENAPKDMHGSAYYDKYIKGRGVLGTAFINYYKGHIKMGDTPSLGYLMKGNPDDPQDESWGGRYTRIRHSSKKIFQGNSDFSDSVPAYGVVEWQFHGPKQSIPHDSVCFTMEILGQVWPGYYIGNGIYAIRYSSKKPEKVTYQTKSAIKELNGLTGGFISTTPWPGKQQAGDYKLGENWFGDLPDEEFFLDDQQGVRTLSIHRVDFLSDWAKRWAWLESAKAAVPRDTSFTLQGTYLKERKYHPYISIAETNVDESIHTRLNLEYDRIEERPLFLDVFYPKGDTSKRYPGVLLIHGGGWQSGDKSQMHAIGKALAAKGYVAVAVEYRLTLEAKYPEAVYDLKSAVRWMRANADKFQLDMDYIATLGTSAGGQLASLLGVTNGNPDFEGNGRGNVKYTSDIQAIVNIDGTLAFRHPESFEGNAASNWLNGTYEENTKNWESAAPLNHVSQKSVPIIFLNSSIPRFHAGRDDMIKKLDRYGIYWEIREFPDTPHPFWFFNPWFQPMMDYTVAFLDRNFK